MSITKNENGTLSIGDIEIISSYDKETKKHTFTLLKVGCMQVNHVGNHLTLRNNLHKLVAELESTSVSQSQEASSESNVEDIFAPLEFVEFVPDENAPASDYVEYNLFKNYLEAFANASNQEDRDFAAEMASIVLLRMDISAV